MAGKPYDRRTLLKVRSRVVGRCTCDTCDPNGEWAELRDWLATEAHRAKPHTERKTKARKR
jgi:hypothetical protein